jgi:F0F1-type ATP synthase membrane subunit a
MTSHLQLPLADLMDHVLPHEVTRVGGFIVTNHIVMMVVAAVLMLGIFSYVGQAARTNLVPRGMHNLFEAILSFLRTELIRPALGANSDKFTPFIWTVFFFILFCNLLGLFPVNEIIGLITGNERYYWGTATANILITAAMAIVTFVIVHVSGIIQQVRVKMDPSLAPHHSGNDHAHPHGHGQMEGIEDERDVVLEHRVGDGHDHAHGMHHSKEFHGQPFPQAVVTGIGAYVWNFAPHPEIGNPIGDMFMWVALLGLELIGSLVKPFSLCIRLFANMLAGHMVLAALISMIPIGVGIHWALTGGVGVVVVAGCTALSLLELFVAFLQAYIFAFLTTLFIASAVAPEH